MQGDIVGTEVTLEEVSKGDTSSNTLPAFVPEDTLSSTRDYSGDALSHDSDGDGIDEIYYLLRGSVEILRHNGINYSIDQTVELYSPYIQAFDIDGDNHEEIIITGGQSPTYGDLVGDRNCNYDCRISNNFMKVFDTNGTYSIKLDYSLHNKEYVKLNNENYIVSYSSNKVDLFRLNFPSGIVIVDSLTLNDVNSVTIFDMDNDNLEEIIFANDKLNIYSLSNDNLIPINSIEDPNIDTMETKIMDIFGDGNEVLTIRGSNSSEYQMIKYYDIDKATLESVYTSDFFGLYGFDEGYFAVGNFTNISNTQIVVSNREIIKLVFFNTTSGNWEFKSISLRLNTYNVRNNKFLPNIVNGETTLLYIPLQDFSFIAQYKQDKTNQQIRFELKQVIPFPMHQTDSAKTDLNQDDLSDMITAHEGGQFYIYLNNGTSLNLEYRVQFSNSSVRTSGNPTSVSIISRDKVPTIIASHGPDLFAFQIQNNKVVEVAYSQIGDLFGDHSRAITEIESYNVDNMGVEELAVNTFQHGSDDGSFAVLNLTSSGFELVYHEYISAGYRFFDESDLQIYDFNSDGFDDILLFGSTSNSDYEYAFTVLSYKDGAIPYFNEEYLQFMNDPNIYFGGIEGDMMNIVNVDGTTNVAILLPIMINQTTGIWVYSFDGTHNLKVFEIDDKIFSLQYIGAFDNNGLFLRRSYSEDLSYQNHVVELLFDISNQNIEFEVIGLLTTTMRNSGVIADILH